MQDSESSQPGAGLGDEAHAPSDPQLDAEIPAADADERADGGIPVAPAPAADAAPGEDPAEKLREERLTTLFEAAVYGPGDERIGKVGQVYVDDQTQEPNWVTVKTGLFGTREYFLPLDEAVLDGRKLIVPYAKDIVVAAPGTEIDQNLSPAEEDTLYNYYRVPGRMTETVAEDETLVAPTGVIPSIPVDGDSSPVDGDSSPVDGGEAGQLDEAHPAGSASDADFTSDIRAEHGSSDEPRGGEGARFAREDEGELGTERVHDESRGEGPGAAAPGEAEAVRERYAAERETDRLAEEDANGTEAVDLADGPVRIGYDGIPHAVDDAESETAFRGPDAAHAEAPGGGSWTPPADVVSADGLGLDEPLDEDGEIVELDDFRRPEER